MPAGARYGSVNLCADVDGAPGSDFIHPDSANDSGCGCAVLGDSSDSSFGYAMLGALGLVGALFVRRRRR